MIPDEVKSAFIAAMLRCDAYAHHNDVHTVVYFHIPTLAFRITTSYRRDWLYRCYPKGREVLSSMGMEIINGKADTD